MNPEAAVKQDPTQSPQFKSWFGNSKVVDSEGRPLPVYHGSPSDFQEFNVRNIGKNGRNEGSGFYFTTDPDTAAGYGNGGKVYSVYLSIQKPIPYDTKGLSVPQLKKFLRVFMTLEARENQEDWRDGFMSNVTYTYDKSFEQVVLEGVRLLNDGSSLLDQIGGLAGAGADTTTINQALLETFGYDGIVSNGYSNAGPGPMGSGAGTIWVAFFPTQIKSVDNRGGWSTGDANIHQGLVKGRYQRALLSRTEVDHLTDPKFKKLFREFWATQGAHGKKGLRALPGFPEGLDLENWEVEGIDRDGIHFTAGGDWQDMTAFVVGLDKGKLAVVGRFESLNKKVGPSLDEWLAQEPPK